MATTTKAIRLLKDHHSGGKKGDVSELSLARADYLVRTKQAEYVESSDKSPVKRAKSKSTKGGNQAPCPTC